MSSYSELQCFNKLLLEKMQRMQKKIEKLEKENSLLTNYAKQYNSLVDCVDLDDVDKCWECELWHERCNMYQIGDTDVCESCYNKKNYFQCDNCGEHYCEDEMKKMKHYSNEICNRCYKGYIIVDGDSGVNDGDDVNEMVFNKDKVMEELLKKVKKN